MAREHSLCREIGHAWGETTVFGWFQCERLSCRVNGYCPGCLGCRPADARLVAWCAAHEHCVPSLAAYPVAASDADMAASADSSVAQASMW